MTGRRSRARCSSRPGRGCARSSSRAPARPTGCETVNREVTRRARRRRRLRRLDARQDRHPGPGRRRHSSTASTSTRSRRLPVGKARYGLMLREDGFVLDDGTTSRARRRALRRDDDHGERRQGDAASRVLPSGAVAGARRADRLGHRAVGAVRGRRARARATCWRVLVDPPFDISQRRRSRIMACARADGVRRRPGAAVPHLVLGRARLRDRACRRATATRWRAR